MIGKTLKKLVQEAINTDVQILKLMLQVSELKKENKELEQECAALRKQLNELL